MPTLAAGSEYELRFSLFAIFDVPDQARSRRPTSGAVERATGVNQTDSTAFPEFCLNLSPKTLIQIKKYKLNKFS